MVLYLEKIITKILFIEKLNKNIRAKQQIKAKEQWLMLGTKILKNYFSELVKIRLVQQPTQSAWLALLHTALHGYDIYFQAGWVSLTIKVAIRVGWWIEFSC